MEEEFTTINRRGPAAQKRNRRLANKSAYIKWAEEIWPEMLVNFLNLAMEKYERAQPKQPGELQADYDFRYNKARIAAERRHGTCNKTVEDCIAAGHQDCEDKRRQAYEVYMEDQKFIGVIPEAEFKTAEGTTLEIPKKIEDQGIPPIAKAPQDGTVKVKKVKKIIPPSEEEDLSSVSKEEVPLVVVTPPVPVKVIVKKKAPKEKTDSDKEIDALCEELAAMPERKPRKKK